MFVGREEKRLFQNEARTHYWKRWGPYLSERQWGTVREDYSEYGNCWAYFPHDHARSRAYRWGEDGLLGITDSKNRLSFALALWNGHDPILKERLFGLTGPEGNHGEDVKECYYYLDSTPTHSYMKALYKYPINAFPYQGLVEENRKRTRDDPEFELIDTGIFSESKYFDVTVEYAKAGPEDILIRISLMNRSSEETDLYCLPTLWFRNTWSWGRSGEGYGPKPNITRMNETTLLAKHASLSSYLFAVKPQKGLKSVEFLFTDNETHNTRLYQVPNASNYVKDAFHEYLINGRKEVVNPREAGTKAAAIFHLKVGAGQEKVIQLRLKSSSKKSAPFFGKDFDAIFDERISESDEFYSTLIPDGLSKEEKNVMRQAYAGLLWSKQFYHFSIKDWLQGDPAQPPPSPNRLRGKNADWGHLYNRDVISIPDKWEYPWYAAWDLCFHMIPFAKVDPVFAKEQMVLLLREWYMHPNGQLPAYEFEFSDVNPPVHAWASWRIYKITAPRGERDRLFLSRVFQKLLINFTWWVNRKDREGKHLFSGGFLGLDNIGVFDRSRPLPSGGHLEQADGTAWMAFYCSTMLSMALELAKEDPVYEDIASKFFEHFVAIVDAMNTLGGTGLWDEKDGFYYDQLHLDHQKIPLRVRSLVGLIPLCAVEVLDDAIIEKLPNFSNRMHWFLENRQDLGSHISYMCGIDRNGECHRLLAIPSRERLERVLKYMLDENEFLSPYGLRSLSKVHKDHPYIFSALGEEHRVDYEPGESRTGVFGGNSNWRGPVWFPINYLLIEALERYHHFYGDTLKVECPTGSGKQMNLKEVSMELSTRLSRLFLPLPDGSRPYHGNDFPFASDPCWKELVSFYEHFHGDTGRGLGASHQTGWTALVIRSFEDLAHFTNEKHKRNSAASLQSTPRGLKNLVPQGLQEPVNSYLLQKTFVSHNEDSAASE